MAIVKHTFLPSSFKKAQRSQIYTIYTVFIYMSYIINIYSYFCDINRIATLVYRQIVFIKYT